MRSPSYEGRDKDQKGLLWILDEEAMFAGATEKSFLEHLFQVQAQRTGKRTCFMGWDSIHMEKNPIFIEQRLSSKAVFGG